MTRLHDTRRYLMAVAEAIDQAAGIPSHIDGQNNTPPPAVGVYANLRIDRGPRAASRLLYRDAFILSSASVTVPDPLPPVGTTLFMRVRPRNSLFVGHTVAVGDTVVSVRDSLLAQLALHPGGDPAPPNLGAGYWSATAVGVGSIELLPLEFGGLGPKLVTSGLLLNSEQIDSTAITGQCEVTIRMSVRGTGRLSADNLDAVVGRDGSAAVAAAILAFFLAPDVAPILTAAGLELWELPIEPVQAPVDVGGEIEVQQICDLIFGCTAEGYRAPRIAGTSIQATITTTSPAISGATSGSSSSQNLNITV